MKTKWLRGPTCPGLWWYWLLGSGVVRHQDVIRMRGWGMFGCPTEPGLYVQTTGWKRVNQTARLWCKQASKPKLPPKRLQRELEQRFCPQKK